jgi:hypothetical protein
MSFFNLPFIISSDVSRLNAIPSDDGTSFSEDYPGSPLTTQTKI